MMNHAEIRQLLSAYCSGELSPAERAWVEEHLSSCPSCRAELAELKAVVKAIRSTPSEEPPQWLSSRIMATIVEQTVERESWLQRLFFPLHIKLPLEILALLVICVTGYYMTRTPDLELIQAVPQLKPPAAEIQQPQAKPAEEQKLSDDAGKAVPAPSLQKHDRKAEETAQEPKYATPPAKTAPAADRQQLTAEQEQKGARPVETETGMSSMRKAAPAREQLKLERTPADRQESTAAPAPAAGMISVRVTLIMGLETLSKNSVRQAVTSSGGTMMPTSAVLSDRQLKARIPASRLGELLDRLEKLARIVERPAEVQSAGTVEIEILW